MSKADANAHMEFLHNKRIISNEQEMISGQLLQTEIKLNFSNSENTHPTHNPKTRKQTNVSPNTRRKIIDKALIKLKLPKPIETAKFPKPIETANMKT